MSNATTVVRTLIVDVVGNIYPIPTGTSGRFPFRTVTLFAPDDYYLGTRKFMDLLTVPPDLVRTRKSYRGSYRAWTV